MHHLSAFIDEPSALDAFAYRGNLYVLTFDGRLLTYDVQHLVRDLSDAHGQTGLAVAYALFSSKGIGAGPEMKSASVALDQVPSSMLRVKSSPSSSFQIPIEASALLDMRIFYNQIFLAADIGTYRFRLDSAGKLSEGNLKPERMLAAPTESLSTGMGAVAASLGDEGLAVFLDVHAREPSRETRIESRSLRSSIGWGQAINHPTHDSYEVLKSETIKDPSGKTMLVAVSRANDQPHNGPESRGSGTYAFWEFGRMLVGNHVGVASFGRLSSHGRRRAVTNSFDGKLPLSLGVTGNRCIVTETRAHVTAARGDRSVVIHHGEAASVRTFGGSQRYQRLIASTVEGGLLLSAVFLSREDWV
ncbi:hypothetical protein [Pseudarthrobacter sp. CCNWLW207]|uniref:hypothetical protein n=1 Tax=Pseudarthrobacter sp. CCNWLW207 TaxID=3127468 RepID=UPI00307870FC